jgi:transcriptional regulator with GAF, ATPase, and Fis domain
VALDGPLAGRSFPVGDGGLTLGRHESNLLVVPEIAVSRHHAVIETAADGHRLRDLESRHGTLVNGAPITEHRLGHGDLLTVGGSTFVFLRSGAPPVDDDAPIQLDDTTLLAGSTLRLDPGEVLALRPPELLPWLADAARRQRALEVLLRAATELGGCRRLGELGELVVGLALDAVPAARAALLLAAPGGEDRFEPVFVREGRSRNGRSRKGRSRKGDDGDDGAPIPISRTATLLVMGRGEALLANDLRRVEELRDAGSLLAGSVGGLLCTPLLTAAGSRPWGVLYLDRTDGDEPFAEDELRLATALAGMAAPAVAHLRELAWVDGERRRLQAESLDHEMVGESEAMARVTAMITRVAPADSTVLLLGESGTGKELAARAIHRASGRRDRPFVAINCATLTETLLESELFGHEKGAFTGAVARKTGKLEVADTGTLFLDEVGELPAPLQAKLLRVLQERELERVGGTRPIRVDLRVIAATNRDLEDEIEAGRFRQDLFYRLNVVPVRTPPLRERLEDVPVLVDYFVRRYSRLNNYRPRPFDDDALAYLQALPWPGNVRELKNLVERLLILAPGDSVSRDDVIAIAGGARPDDLGGAVFAVQTLREFRETAEKLFILRKLEENDWNVTQTAQAIDTPRSNLYKKLDQYDIRREDHEKGGEA